MLHYPQQHNRLQFCVCVGLGPEQGFQKRVFGEQHLTYRKVKRFPSGSLKAMRGLTLEMIHISSQFSGRKTVQNLGISDDRHSAALSAHLS